MFIKRNVILQKHIIIQVTTYVKSMQNYKIATPNLLIYDFDVGEKMAQRKIFEQDFLYIRR